jgi:hypothetical protein
VLKTAAVVLGFLSLMLFPTISRAQLLPNGNVYVGGAYADSVDVVNRYTFRGWNASVEAIPFARRSYLGITLDTSGFYRKGVQQYNFLLGPRISKNFGKWRVFAQVMGGVQRTTSGGMTNYPVAEDGGMGADHKFKFLFLKNAAWRLQFDYTRTRLYSATQNDFRGSTGLVWRF